MIKLPIAALVVIVGLLGGFYGGYKVGGGGTTANAAAATTGNRTAANGFAGRGVTAACPSPGATPAPSASGAGARVMGSPARAVGWLANALARVGAELHAGMLVFTGAAADPIDVLPGHVISAEFAHLGRVGFTAT